MDNIRLEIEERRLTNKMGFLRLVLIILIVVIIVAMLAIYSSLASSKRADESLNKILQKRKEERESDMESIMKPEDIDGFGTTSDGSRRTTKRPLSQEGLELYRKLYPKGATVSVISLKENDEAAPDLVGTIKDIDEMGMVHCIRVDGNNFILNPEKDSFNIMK
jgi:type II secretory pathway pseudopilin PulG